MKAEDVVFQDLLNGKLQYRVPLFQREYTWDEEQWDRLWEDILEVYEMPKPQRHFIGSIVTQLMDHSPEDAAKFMLIDGQQRMTSLLIMLAVIRYHSLHEDTDLADEIRDTCLSNRYAKKLDERMKLRPTQSDRDPFQRAMNGVQPDPKSKVGKSWTHFSNLLGGGDSDDNPIDLRRLKDRITSYFDLVSIRLQEGDSPNRIFESLNNTGVPLEASDLVRNYVFMRIPDETEQEVIYQNDWLPMQEALGKARDDFFWRYSMKDGELTRRDDVFDEIKRNLDKLPDKAVPSVIKAFSTFSRYYLRMREPLEHEACRKLRERLAHINTWEVDVCYPMLLTLFDMHANGKVTTSDLIDVIAMTESFVVRRAICGVPTNQYRRIFAGMITQSGDGDLSQLYRDHLLKNKWPSDDEFHNKLVSYRIYNPARLKRSRLILHSLETSFKQKEGPSLDDEVTIEHLMPQTLTPEWKEMLGDDAYQVHSAWLDTLGNLTLTKRNPELSNMTFKQKKEILQNSGFALTTNYEEGVLRYEVWNADAIQERAQRLAGRALKIWNR